MLRWQTGRAVTRYSDTSPHQNLLSADYPSRCQPGDRDCVSDRTRMGSSSAVGGSGGLESRPVSMPTPCAGNSCGPRIRLIQTHQTHQTHLGHPTIPNLRAQTHQKISPYLQTLMTLVVSLVSFAPPCRSLSEKIFVGGLYRTVGAGGLTLEGHGHLD